MTTTNTTPIHDLWNAMGGAGIQPRNIKRRSQSSYRLTDEYNYEWLYTFDQRSHLPIADEHAGFILTGHAEKWLRGRGWNIISPGDVHEREYEHEPRGTGYISLPDALLAEAGRE